MMLPAVALPASCYNLSFGGFFEGLTTCWMFPSANCEEPSLMHHYQTFFSVPGRLQTFSWPPPIFLPTLLSPGSSSPSPTLSSFSAIRQMPRLLSFQNVTAIEEWAGTQNSNGSEETVSAYLVPKRPFLRERRPSQSNTLETSRTHHHWMWHRTLPEQGSGRRRPSLGGSCCKLST